MRSSVLVSLGLTLITGARGQQIPVPIVSGHLADEGGIERPSPNVHNVPPRQTIRVYRDSAGRTRIDPPVPPNQISTHFAVINDPLAGFLYSLDSENKVARRFGSVAVAMRTVPATVQPLRADIKIYTPASTANITTHSDSLGMELIEGLSAEGTRITTNHPETPRDEAQENIKETWFSPDLQMTLRIQVPPDYTVIDPPASRPVK